MAKRKPEKITLSKSQKNEAIKILSEYINENLEYDISNLQADMLLDFISEKLGGIYYNKAIEDAMAYMTERAEDMFILMKENS